MISLLPAFHETLVLPIGAAKIYQILSAATSNKPFIQSDEKSLFFNGWVKEENFRISLRVRRTNNYLPLIIGRIESVSAGSILLVDYVLFPAIRLLLTLWTILLILGSLIISYQEKNFLFLLGGTGAITLIHAIVLANFKLQLKLTREALHHILF